MKVDTLYIIGSDNKVTDDSLLQNCNGLFFKYNQKASHAVSVFIGQNNATPVNKFLQIMGTPPLACERPKEMKETAQVDASPKKRAVGVYLVFHGSSAKGGDEAEIQVKMLRRIIPAEQIKNIEKIALVSCAIAKSSKFANPNDRRAKPGDTRNNDVSNINKIKLPDEQPNKKVKLPDDQSTDDDELEISQVSFLLGFMKYLHELGSHPMVAGWETYVSSFPHLPGTVFANGDKYHPQNPPPEKLNGGKFIMEKVQGYEAHQFVKVDESLRGKHKKIMRTMSNGEIRYNVEGWSDK